ncbi:Conserved_hypothetical protein [Hexamita inflata]|uniref:Uncharacterized protein n=1 Tax=Hexamita inflata TaxID=28002 RepID=A0AA86N4D1_9EUKA|nr:Conserved hypothetical protein [Hexamita inflata]
MYVQNIYMCSTSMFPRVLYSNDSAYQLVLTQSGANTYLTKYLSSGLFNGLKFPDQHFDVNLGVSSVQFLFENMIVSYFNVSQTVSFLNGDNITQVSFMGCEFVLDLDWKMQQNSYPYQSDSGSGKILIQDASFSMIVTTRCDYVECYNTLVDQTAAKQAGLGLGGNGDIIDRGKMIDFQGFDQFRQLDQLQIFCQNFNPKVIRGSWNTVIIKDCQFTGSYNQFYLQRACLSRVEYESLLGSGSQHCQQNPGLLEQNHFFQNKLVEGQVGKFLFQQLWGEATKSRWLVPQTGVQMLLVRGRLQQLINSVPRAQLRALLHEARPDFVFQSLKMFF